MAKKSLRDRLTSAGKAVSGRVTNRGKGPESAAGPKSDDAHETTAVTNPEPSKKAEPAKEAPAKKAPAKKAPAKKAPAKKAPAKKAPAKEAPAKKAPAKKAPVKNAPAKKAPAKKAPAKKAPANEAPAKKAPAKKAPANKAPAKEAPAKKAPAKEAPAKKAPAKKAPAKKAEPVNKAQVLRVKETEDPWTPAELAAIRSELNEERVRISEEISAAEASLQEMLRDAGEGSGDDQADQGSRTFEREQEMSLAANSREMRDQVDRALRRLDDGTYGICENCGEPIGKMRLQAYPRATLCLSCKEQEERR